MEFEGKDPLKITYVRNSDSLSSSNAMRLRPIKNNIRTKLICVNPLKMLGLRLIEKIKDVFG